MDKTTWIALAVAAGVLYLVYRAKMNDTPLNPASENTVHNIASPEQDAAYWAIFSGGTPSPAGSTGAGETTPAIKIIDRVSALFRGELGAWGAPNAGEGAYQVPSFSPPGATVLPGPVPPGQPTPQSATDSSSPWVPNDLTLAYPLAANPWFFELSEKAPGSSIALKNGFIDVEHVSEPVTLDTVNA